MNERSEQEIEERAVEAGKGAVRLDPKTLKPITKNTSAESEEE